MDSAEEDLKKKLNALERGVFDPALNGRGEEIWARMLAIRERSRRLMLEIERVGSAKGDGAEGEGGIDEGTMKTARKVCFIAFISPLLSFCFGGHFMEDNTDLFDYRSWMTMPLKSTISRTN